MKKIITFVTILLVGLSAALADEYVISNIECYSSEGFYDRELTFKYDDEEDVYYICRYTYSTAYWFTFTPTQLEKLREVLSKTQEWVKIASENRTSITKELPDSAISVRGIMKQGNNWYTTKWDIPLNFFFISQISENSELLTLFIRGNKEDSKQNQFIDIEFESVVFFDDGIEAFAKAISPETIEAAKEKHAQEKKSEDLFN